MENSANRAELCGRFVTLPSLSHENHGQKFYHFYLEVDRLSGASDVLRIIAPEPILYQTELTDGDMLFVRGQVRSYNENTESGRRLRIFVYADRLECRRSEALNSIALTGTVCRPPVYRRTPLGREICDLMLAVPRGFRRTDYIPCIAWGRTARAASGLGTGDLMELLGRLQSRDYVKTTPEGAEQRTAYEVSILSAQFPEKPDAKNFIELM